MDFDEVSGEVWSGPRRKWLDFGGDPNPFADFGSCRIFTSSHLEKGCTAFGSVYQVAALFSVKV